MRDFWLEQAEANRYINRTWLDVMEGVPFAELEAPRGAFFGSLFGTWNHLLLGDRVWLGRLEGTPYAVKTLADRQAETLATFRAERTRTDEHLLTFIGAQQDFAREFGYTSRQGQPSSWSLRSILAHLFAHQHHHRGQISQMSHELGLPLPDGALSPYYRSTGKPM